MMSAGQPAPPVWVVDHSALQLELVRRALEPRHEVRLFADAAEALEALEIDDAPGLLIADLNMPGMSGLELCRFVRGKRGAAELPILILTAGDEPDDVVAAFAAGANDFLPKPYAAAALGARVDAHLRAKRLYDELLAIERQLRIEAKFREDFIGMLAHDLRQPLSTFSMANGALERLECGDGAARLLGIQKRSTDRMGRMIADLLDLTRSRPAAGMPIDATSTDLAAIVRSLVDDLRVTYPMQPFDLRTRGSATGTWDPDRLMQLCGNLIGNALEHAAPGSAIAVDVDGSGADVVLQVENQGRPIPDELLPHLFEPFRRGRGGKGGGVGLGLYIASAIVRAHRGTIAARSGERTVFEVTLPRA